MARPLRIEYPNARHHVLARGNERRAIFIDDRDRRRFVEVLAELPERYGVRVHAWVLMDNHYHLLLETPEANLGRACQWLNVSYSVWFNRRHRRSGHLFQGRFKSVLVDEESWLEVARYVHLNPVRVAGLSLGKRDRARQATAAAREPGARLVQRRLECLRRYRWSSYRALAGLDRVPEWLTVAALVPSRPGATSAAVRAEFREYHEAPLREGRLESVWDRVVGGAVLGSCEFVEAMKERLGGLSREVSKAGMWRRTDSWERIIAAVEVEHGGQWMEFRDRHGDWGRDVAIYLGRRKGRMTLRDLGAKVGGLGPAATGQVVSRVSRRAAEDSEMARRLQRIQLELSKTEM